ncbi:MAG TPA: hypothetical protein PKA27_06950 [Fimbriimonadaceae bacterium]|nr:hypothetical protein [Fimbriimonadaceae bacterium]
MIEQSQTEATMTSETRTRPTRRAEPQGTCTICGAPTTSGPYCGPKCHKADFALSLGAGRVTTWRGRLDISNRKAETTGPIFTFGGGRCTKVEFENGLDVYFQERVLSEDAAIEQAIHLAFRASLRPGGWPRC